MKTLSGIFLAAALCAPSLLADEAAHGNWTPPAAKMQVQTLSEQVMAAHSELISVTFHGVPPGLSKVYTMFGGSYVDRIGNPDDPDDIMVSETGVTILDPRWHRTKDKIRKFVVMIPLRDAAAENCGLLVLAFRNPEGSAKSALDFLVAGTKIRDDLEPEIPTYEGLYAPAK
jgi:hypothetical protein